MENMTKKFVRSEWDDEPIGFGQSKGIEASSLVLDLFQSFEDRLTLLQTDNATTNANTCMLSAHLNDVKDKLEKFRDDTCENAAKNFTKYSTLEKTTSSLENKVMDLEDRISELQTENKSLRDDVNYLREKILSKEEQQKVIREMQRELEESKRRIEAEAIDKSFPRLENIGQVYSLSKDTFNEIIPVPFNNDFDKPIEIEEDDGSTRITTLRKEKDEYEKAIKGFRFHEGPAPIAGYENFITRDGFNFMAQNVLDKTEPTKPKRNFEILFVKDEIVFFKYWWDLEDIDGDVDFHWVTSDPDILEELELDIDSKKFYQALKEFKNER